jgi:hypothetical protein
MAPAMDSSTRIHGSRLPLLSAALAAALATAAPLPMPAAATDALQRCRAPDGTIGYTDRRCAVFGSESAPLPGDLMARIVREEARGVDFDSIDADGMQAEGMQALGLNHSVAPGRRSPASGCARSPAQLAMDVHAALALGDVNRVAESYHFAGMSSDAGERTLDRLQRLVGRPVLESQYFDASIASAGGTGVGTSGFVDGATLLAGSGDGGTGMLQLVLGNGEGGASTVDFDVRRYAGCYFVRF